MGSVDYIYGRGSFGVDWNTTWEEYNAETDGYESYHSSGAVSAVFTGPPERILPGETVTVTGRFTSSATTDYYDLSEVESSYAYAYIMVSGNAENIGAYENEYEIPVNTFGYAFEDTQAVSFTLPEGTEGSTAWVEVNLGLHQTMRTTYYYKYVSSQTPAVGPSLIELGGLVRSAENKPMSWMKLQAWVYYEKDTYTGGQPDLIVDGLTDHLGRYSLRIPLRENDPKPVGILLAGTLECQYPFESGKTLFYFVDTKDSVSVSNDMTSVSTWLTVNPVEYAGTVAPDEPIRINRLLAFYHLGLGAWSFDHELMPDPIYYFSTGDQVQTLQNLSCLYTAAFDAWFFGAATLKEEQALLGNTVRIETRLTPNPQHDTSYYSPADNTIHLVEHDSKRDDNSRYTILHEFGHAFDSLSLGNGSFRAALGYAPGDVNHGGILNGSTSDSYLEGFATFYAGLVQKYSGYKNPGKLDGIKLDDPHAYIAWWDNGKHEEYAIASLLYYAHDLIGDLQSYWTVLKPDRLNFAEYYAAIRAALSAEDAQKLDDYAYTEGLFTQPFGNGQCDKGEAYMDANGNQSYDAGEWYFDTMYQVDASGKIDPWTPLSEVDRSTIVIGSVAGAGQTRQSLIRPADQYLSLTGAVPEYLLVDLTTAQGTMRMLRAVDGDRILLGLPDLPTEGTVTVSVPGGGVVYTGDIAALQIERAAHPGQEIPLDAAEISWEALAPEGTQAVAAYGDPGATGVMETPVFSAEALAQAAQAYSQGTALEELANEEPASDSGWEDPDYDPGSGSSEYEDYPEERPDEDASSGASRLLPVLLIGAVVVAAVVTLLIVLGTRSRRRGFSPPYPGPRAPDQGYPAQQYRGQQGPGQQIPVQQHPGNRAPEASRVSGAIPVSDPSQAPNTVIPPKVCPRCGAPCAPAAGFCPRCGTRLMNARICANCGAPLAPNARFCNKCGCPAVR
jgi:ribosomal protein L40E